MARSSDESLSSSDFNAPVAAPAADGCDVFGRWECSTREGTLRSCEWLRERVCAILVEPSESETEAACGGVDDAAVADAEGGGASPGKT